MLTVLPIATIRHFNLLFGQHKCNNLRLHLNTTVARKNPAVKYVTDRKAITACWTFGKENECEDCDRKQITLCRETWPMK